MGYQDISPGLLRERVITTRRLYDAAITMDPPNSQVVSICLERLEGAVAKTVINGDWLLTDALRVLDRAAVYGLRQLQTKRGIDPDLVDFLNASRVLYGGLFQGIRDCPQGGIDTAKALRMLSSA